MAQEKKGEKKGKKGKREKGNLILLLLFLPSRTLFPRNGDRIGKSCLARNVVSRYETMSFRIAFCGRWLAIPTVE